MNPTLYFDEGNESLDAPRFQKWNRPDRSSARESVRKGICRARRANPSPNFSRSASFKKRASMKY